MAGYACRIPTSTGTQLVKRFGYTSNAEVETAARHVARLLDLAPDDATRNKIGDMIAAAKRGARLPTTEEVAQRISLRQDPGSAGVTFGEYWTSWLAGKRKLRASSHRRLEQIGRHWLMPVLADVPLERLSGDDWVAGLVLDVADEAGMQRWVADSAAQFGGLDIAVANVSALAIPDEAAK
jgi:NAD(P)-dependent dehydrogenase (short-subunit alcohol dehydrogenase family)